MCFTVYLSATLIAASRAIIEVLALVEAKILLAEEMQLCDSLQSVRLSKSNCIRSLERTLEVGGEDMEDLHTGDS
jgi:hypothetical protein